MAIRKKSVASAVNSVAKKATKPAESVSTTQDQDWDKLLINSTDSSESSDSSSPEKRYEYFMGKDRLVREEPGWGSCKGKIVQFVIYGSDENGNPLPDLPKTRFGSLADVEYCEKKYPMDKGFYVNDQVCRNGRHKINIYKIHIVGVRDVVEEVE